MRPIWHAALALVLSAAAQAQPSPASKPNAFQLEPGTYPVGFRLIATDDRSRMVTGGAGVAPRARPVRTYLWYPAETARRGRVAEPMRFGRYAALADDDVWPAEMIGSLHDKLAYSRRPLARSFDEADYAQLLQRPVLAVENAEPAAGPFPLVVIGVGFWYEPAISQAALGEYLAGRGFVVAIAPLVGTNSPVVRVDEELETFVRDLELAIARARELPFVSADKLGVVGMDMGGMAGVLLAMRHRDVNVFVGLPSGILFEHPSGLPRSSPGYDPLALRVPWLQIMPAGGAAPPPGSRSPSLFEGATHSDRYLLLTPNLGHVNLTINGLIDGRGPMIGGAYQQATPTGVEAHRALRPYVLNFLTAFLAPEADRRAAGLAFMARPPANVPGFEMTLEHRPAAPASITYDELVATVVAGNGAEAVERLRASAAANPNDPLLSEGELQRLVENLLFTWGLGRETLPLIGLMIERYPSSPAGRILLAEAEIAAGDYAAAADVYTKFLEQYPNNPVAKSRLEWLGSR